MVLDPQRGLSKSSDPGPTFGLIEDACGGTDYYEEYDLIKLVPERKAVRESVIPEDLEHNVGSRTADSGHSMPLRPANRAKTRQRQFQKREFTKENLTDHQLLVLHPVTRAFALKTKTWCKYFHSKI